MYDLTAKLKAKDLGKIVLPDLRGFSPTQKMALRAELTAMIEAEIAIEDRIVGNATSGIWARIGAIARFGGRRDFRIKDEEARGHDKRVRYFKELRDLCGVA